MASYSALERVLRAVSNTLRIPMIVILIAMIIFALLCVGWIIAEGIWERRYLNRNFPKTLTYLKKNKKNLPKAIQTSGLLRRQKEVLLELTKHPDFSTKELESLADNLREKEEAHYNGIVKWTDTLSKLAPMAGLMGTLIPLGPGIIALGQGQTQTLSESLLIAFDTTIAGLLVAGICIIISTIRKRWYVRYMSDLETLIDFVVKAESRSHVKQQRTKKQ